MLFPTVRRLARFGKSALLTPRRVNESCERLRALEADMKRIEGALLTFNGNSDAQRYAGYSGADLGLFPLFHVHGLEPTPGFITDFLGTRIRTTCVHSASRHLDGTVLGVPVPADFHSEAAEWVGLLKAVLSCKGSFRAMELGAGWGPWIVAGAVAARTRGINDVFLCGVEADPDRYEMMRQHLRDNDIDPSRHALLLGAVGAAPGRARWPKGYNPTDDMGTRPLRPEGERCRQGSEGVSDYRGFVFNEYMDVEVFALSDLVARQPVWDFVHIDVQGWEGEICAAGVGALNERVRWSVIGTHSRKLDGDLVDLFCRNGWVLENEKPSRFAYVPGGASLEAMTTTDGVQVWRNPRLC